MTNNNVDDMMDNWLRRVMNTVKSLATPKQNGGVLFGSQFLTVLKSGLFLSEIEFDFCHRPIVFQFSPTDF